MLSRRDKKSLWSVCKIFSLGSIFLLWLITTFKESLQKKKCVQVIQYIDIGQSQCIMLKFYINVYKCHGTWHLSTAVSRVRKCDTYSRPSQNDFWSLWYPIFYFIQPHSQVNLVSFNFSTVFFHIQISETVTRFPSAFCQVLFYKYWNGSAPSKHTGKTKKQHFIFSLLLSLLTCYYYFKYLPHFTQPLCFSLVLICFYHLLYPFITWFIGLTCGFVVLLWYVFCLLMLLFFFTVSYRSILCPFALLVLFLPLFVLA